MLALQIYAKALGVRAPWRIIDIEVDRQDGEIRILIEARPGTGHTCPICGAGAQGRQPARQRWRLPDPTEFDTVLVVDVPRCDCPHHGPIEFPQPWARPGSSFHCIQPE
ncbi:MAG TPA: hypothetical protein VKA64_04300 [Gammaproteobacteria bacterium]|nr:hypothetical protein [Gammaproteobacteria bacterium]